MPCHIVATSSPDLPRESTRLVRSALAGVLTIATTAIGAQEAVGRVFNPRANPSSPDIVAFERLDGDRMELQFRRLSTGTIVSTRRASDTTRRDDIGLPDVAGGRDLAVFSGDLDWRRQTPDGRLWFAYVSSDENGLGLLINYIDPAGALAATAPLRVPFSGNARRPRWSPDGRHLAFVSDSSVLHVFWNIAGALQSGTTAGVRATRIVQAGAPALFPAWSPRGDHIAYQVEKTIRGVRRFAIDVIPVDPAASVVTGAPVTVTEALDESAFRPSWSPDGKYLAFYSSRISQGAGESNSMDVGVVELQLNPTSGRLFRGQIVQGRSRRIAENVIPSESRGPEWTKITVAGQAEAAIAFVQLDQSRNNPILFVGLRPWLAMRPRAEFETGAPPTWGTMNHKDISVTEIDRAMRYVYVSVSGGGESVQFRDAAATWAQAPAPVVVARDEPRREEPGVVAPAAPGRQVVAAARPRGSSLAMALLFPGGGQWAAGRRGKAAVLTLAGVAGAAIGVVGVTSTSAAADKAAAANRLRDRPAWSDAASEHRSAKSLALIGGGAVGAAWLFGVIDAAMTRAAPSSPLTVRVGTATADGRAGLEGRLAVTFPLGASPGRSR